MRDPVAAELLLFARVLMSHPPAARWNVAEELLRDVEQAELLMQASGHAHPQIGDGSLMALCHLRSPAAEPMASDRDFLHSVVIACLALLMHSCR